MRISIPNAVNGIVCLLSLLIEPTTATCNANNCLRALQNPTFTSSASVFCKSYTKANHPSSTAIPKALVNCNGSPAAVSSACSCFLPPVTATSTRFSTVTTKCSTSGKGSSSSLTKGPTSSTRSLTTSITIPICKQTTVTVPGSSCQPQSTCPKPVTATITKHVSTITVTGPASSCSALGTKTITNSLSASTVTLTQPATSCKSSSVCVVTTITNVYSTSTVLGSSCSIVVPTTCSCANTDPIISCSLATQTISVRATSCPTVSSYTPTTCVASTETITVPGATTTLPGQITTLLASSCPPVSSQSSIPCVVSTETIADPGSRSTCPEPSTVTIPAGTTTLPGDTTTLPASSCFPTTITTSTSSPTPPCYPADYPPTFRIKITGTGRAGTDNRYAVLGPISGGDHIVWTTETTHLFRLDENCHLIDVSSGETANVSQGQVQWTALYFNQNPESEGYLPVSCNLSTNGNVLSCKGSLVENWIVCGEGGLEILRPGTVPDRCSLGMLTIETVGP